MSMIVNGEYLSDSYFINLLTDNNQKIPSSSNLNYMIEKDGLNTDSYDNSGENDYTKTVKNIMRMFGVEIETITVDQFVTTLMDLTRNENIDTNSILLNFSRSHLMATLYLLNSGRLVESDLIKVLKATNFRDRNEILLSFFNTDNEKELDPFYPLKVASSKRVNIRNPQDKTTQEKNELLANLMSTANVLSNITSFTNVRLSIGSGNLYLFDRANPSEPFKLCKNKVSPFTYLNGSTAVRTKKNNIESSLINNSFSYPTSLSSYNVSYLIENNIIANHNITDYFLLVFCKVNGLNLPDQFDDPEFQKIKLYDIITTISSYLDEDEEYFNKNKKYSTDALDAYYKAFYGDGDSSIIDIVRDYLKRKLKQKFVDFPLFSEEYINYINGLVTKDSGIIKIIKITYELLNCIKITNFFTRLKDNDLYKKFISLDKRININLEQVFTYAYLTGLLKYADLKTKNIVNGDATDSSLKDAINSIITDAIRRALVRAVDSGGDVYTGTVVEDDVIAGYKLESLNNCSLAEKYYTLQETGGLIINNKSMVDIDFLFDRILVDGEEAIDISDTSFIKNFISLGGDVSKIWNNLDRIYRILSNNMVISQNGNIINYGTSDIHNELIKITDKISKSIFNYIKSKADNTYITTNYLTEELFLKYINEFYLSLCVEGTTYNNDGYTNILFGSLISTTDPRAGLNENTAQLIAMLIISSYVEGIKLPRSIATSINMEDSYRDELANIEPFIKENGDLQMSIDDVFNLGNNILGSYAVPTLSFYTFIRYCYEGSEFVRNLVLQNDVYNTLLHPNTKVFDEMSNFIKLYGENRLFKKLMEDESLDYLGSIIDRAFIDVNNNAADIISAQSRKRPISADQAVNFVSSTVNNVKYIKSMAPQIIRLENGT